MAWGTGTGFAPYTPSFVHPFSSPIPTPNLPSTNPFGQWSWAKSHPWPRPVAPRPPRAPAGATTTTPRTVTDPTLALLQQLYGSIETPQQQEARIQREIDAQIEAQRKLIADDYAQQAARAQAQAQAMAAAGQAAAGMSGDLFAAVGGEYNRAAREIQGLSSGLTSGAAAATSADEARANEALARVGPGRITEGGPSGIAGPGQATVQDYLGGVLPGRLLTSAGQAETFGLAGLTAAQNLGATQNAQAQLMTSMRDIQDNETKAISALAAGRADLYHQYKSDADQARVQTISLIQGIQAAQAAAAKVAPTIRNFSDGSTRQYNPTTGRWDPVSLKAQKPNPIHYDTVNGRRVAIDSVTHQVVADYGKAGSGQTKPTNWRITDIPIKGVKHRVAVDPHGKVMWDYGPEPATGAGAKGKTPTPGQVQKQVNSWFYGTNQNQLKLMPKKDAQGNPVYRYVPGGSKGQLDYQSAYRALLAMNLTPQQARSYLDPLYGRGDRGRPYVNANQRAALKKAKVNVNANVLPRYKQPNGKYTYTGAGGMIVNSLTDDQKNKVTDRYLTPDQVEVLQAMGILPPGVKVAGSGLKDSKGNSVAWVYLISHLG